MGPGGIDAVGSRETLLDRTAAVVEQATALVSLAAPAGVVDHLEEELAAARDRGALVVVMTDESDERDSVDVLRTWDGISRAPLLCSVDRERGAVATRDLLHGTGGYGWIFDDYLLEWAVYGCFIGTNWDMGTEVQTPAVDPLPATYDSIRQAVVQAVVHLRDRTLLAADVEAVPTAGPDDPVDLSGRVVNVRQCLLTPATSDYPGEHSLMLETDDGLKVSVGGAGAFLEDYEAREITLRVEKETTATR